MQAIQYTEHGDPVKVARVVDLDRPRPAEGEVLIRVEATPLRAADIYAMQGRASFVRPLPGLPGETGIGRIEEIGAEVRDWSPGDRAYLPRCGTWREYLTAPAADLYRAPRQGPAIELAQVNNNGITASALLQYAGTLRRGDWVIQSAATSNVGCFIVQLARDLGIRTVNLVRRAEAAEELRALGADVVLIDADGLGRRVADATAGAPITLGFDMVGGVTTGHIAECLAEDGVIVVYGQTGSAPAQVPLGDMLFRNLTIRGFLTEPVLRKRGVTRAGIAGIYDDLAAAIIDGRLHQKIAAVYCFGEIQSALRHFLSGAAGKIILVPNLDLPASAARSPPSAT